MGYKGDMNPRIRKTDSRRLQTILVAACLLQISAGGVFGQITENIYLSGLQNGWADGSWATDNLENSSPVLAGSSA